MQKLHKRIHDEKNTAMIIKVCGIREQGNLEDLCDLPIDMIGINFYEPSSRYIGDSKLKKKDGVKNVGVFVSAPLDTIMEAAEKHELNYAQLHGDESSAVCKEVQKNIPIIKVFRIDEGFDWEVVSDFDFADYFLFDTKTNLFGGSGTKFDWSALDNYNLSIPFLLSGGIGPESVDSIKSLTHEQFVGIDINSKFEISPALKDVELVRKFIKELS